MPDRYRELLADESLTASPMETKKPRLFVAVRERLRLGYSSQNFLSDLMAGLVVALVALPLGMALSIASGVAPQNGLYTVIIAGFIVALLGGSRLQVTGPTAAFVVILVPVVVKFGLSGLLVSGFLAGVLLAIMGIFRMGRLIEFIPHTVTTGFTTGIAVVIATIQIKDFFGLQIQKMPETYFERVASIISAAPTFSPIEFLIACFTLLVLLVWSKPIFSKMTLTLNQKIPAPLVALGLASIGGLALKHFFPEINFSTIQSKFSYLKDGVSIPGIPQAPPEFNWPWLLGGAHGEQLELSFKLLRDLLPSAFAIAILGAIESLLSAVVADGMAKTKHDPDAELLALGIGNMICPFFGGIPATGAIARTATNIRFAATSPLASAIHSIFVLLAVLLFAPYVGYLPMASLAALLILVAYNMADLRHFTQILKIAPRPDVAVLLICFFLTVIFDMVAGVTVGIILASLLFMARMSELTTAYRVATDRHPRLREQLPKEILFYEIAGPLFFGAAQKAVATIGDIADEVRVVIFDLHEVPILDVSGLIALEGCFKALHQRNKLAVITGIQKQPASVILRTDLLRDQRKTFIAQTVEEAVTKAKAFIQNVR